MLSNQLKKQAQLRESIMVIVLLLAICYLFYTYFFVPNNKQSKELKTEITELIEKKTGIKKLNRALKQKHELQAKQIKKQAKMAETLDPRISMLKNQSDSEYQNINQFLNKLTKEETKSNISITSLKYDIPIAKQGYKETLFYMIANGRFVNIMEFLNKIEDIPALISLDRINIKVKENDTEQVHFDLKGTFYQLGSINDNL